MGDATSVVRMRVAWLDGPCIVVFRAVGKNYVHGKDKMGRPVIYMKPRLTPKKMGTQAQQMRYPPPLVTQHRTTTGQCSHSQRLTIVVMCCACAWHTPCIEAGPAESISVLFLCWKHGPNQER